VVAGGLGSSCPDDPSIRPGFWLSEGNAHVDGPVKPANRDDQWFVCPSGVLVRKLDVV
jgi:hypothetical protein